MRVVSRAIGDLIGDHFVQHQQVVTQSLAALNDPIGLSCNTLSAALQAGRKVIVFGNGGSAAQASHLTGELLGRYGIDRRPLPALALGCDPAVVTCIANDFGYDTLFSRQVTAFAQFGDVAIGFSTSGRSANVRSGLEAAATCGATTIAVTGQAGLIGAGADIVIAVPSIATAHIQELHLIVIHVWCAHIDRMLGSVESLPRTGAGAP